MRKKVKEMIAEDGGDKEQDQDANFSKQVRRKQSTKAALPKTISIDEALKKRKKSQKSKSGYESSESEGTKALNEHYEREPQKFVAIGSENFGKLPTIDQARIFLLQKSPK